MEIQKEVLLNIKNTNCLAVYVFILLCEEKNRNKRYIAEHFKMGINKLNRIFTWLNENKLIDCNQKRLQDGRMSNMEFTIESVNEFLKLIKHIN